MSETTKTNATGNELVTLLNRHKGEQYSFGAFVPKNDKDYNGPWDCAEFVAWGIFQLTGELYGCANNNGRPDTQDAYTGFLARDAEAVGRMISITEAWKTPGALLLRKSGKDLIGHVVVSDGRGGTIEAHSTKDGVINSVISGRRWDCGVLPPMINYSANNIADKQVEKLNSAPTDFIYRFTEPPLQDSNVRLIQEKLNELKFEPGDEDAVYGIKTFRAVQAFQYVKGLVVDGEVGPETLAALGLKLK